MSISNEDFLRAIFGAEADNAHVCAFGEDPGELENLGLRHYWAGRKWRDFGAAARAGMEAQNSFFTVSVFDNDPVDGRARRTKRLFRQAHVVVVDDVGTKVLDTSRLPNPSWILETSPGNFQWGYVLGTPEPDAGRFCALIDGLVAAGLATDGKDPGMKGVTRYVRLPNGRNTKAKYGAPGFDAVLTRWEPGLRFTLEALAQCFGIVLPAAGAGGVKSPGVANVDATEDDVWVALDSWGMVSGARTGDGGYHIECPWIDEHTGRADTGTAYWLGGGDFKCHHGHCEHKGRRDLQRWIDARLQAESGGLRRLKCWAFSVVPGYVAPASVGLPTVAGAGAIGSDWFNQITMRNGRAEPTLKNAIIALGAGCGLDRLLRHDDATQMLVLVGAHPNSAEWELLSLRNTTPFFVDPTTHVPVYCWDDNMLTAARLYLETIGVFLSSKDIARDAVNLLAHRKRYSSVAAYLRCLKWDRKPRLEGWLVRNAGAEDTGFNRIVLRKWMLGAVARAICPEEGNGRPAQMDTALTLVGPQGARKSTFLRALAPVQPWHTENSLGDLTNKDAVLRINAAWLVDLAEGGSIKANEVEAVKQFLTTTTDSIRRPYDTQITRYPRRNVFALTVNPDGAGFLKDGTGNRRFWVVDVGTIDVSTLTAERDQLWAEAVVLYDAGEKWYFDVSNPADAVLETEAAAAAEAHRSQTPTEFSVLRCLTHAPTLDARGNLMSWQARPEHLSVVNSIQELLRAVGLDASNTGTFRDTQRALQGAGWSQTRISFRAAAIARNETVWVDGEGTKALRDDKFGQGKTTHFKVWLNSQSKAGRIGAGTAMGTVAPVAGTAAASFADDKAE